jgi:hypothetical protein
MSELSPSQSLMPSLEQVQAMENQIKQLEQRIASLERRLPDSRLFSPKLLTRAFTVLGHVILAQLIIVVPLWVLSFCVAMLSYQ